MKQFHVSAAARPQDIVIQNDIVLIASNIVPFEEAFDEDHTVSGFEYDCTIYSKDEYLLKLARENEELKQDIIDTQLALIELYEGGDA